MMDFVILQSRPYCIVGTLIYSSITWLCAQGSPLVLHKFPVYGHCTVEKAFKIPRNLKSLRPEEQGNLNSNVIEVLE